LKLISWNVNGIRAVAKKGFLNWFMTENPDVLCLQEVKATQSQAPQGLSSPPGYNAYWLSAEKKGYSGVATFTKSRPLKVEAGFGNQKFDSEGRLLMTEFQEFYLFNVYFPNGKKNAERLQFKMDFYDAFLNMAEKKRMSGKPVIFCGDVNTAHKPIDLARPKENENVSGFLPVEREWLDEMSMRGYVDAFRHFHEEPGQYTWWDYKTKARERNIGWRIDYFFVSKEIMPRLKNAFIMANVEGSDHCPISILLDAK
jgi:exodeoxyribonuclease-3